MPVDEYSLSRMALYNVLQSKDFVRLFLSADCGLSHLLQPNTVCGYQKQYIGWNTTWTWS